MKKHFKNLLIICVISVICVSFLSGCGNTSQERIATLQATLTTIQQASSDVDQQITILQSTTIPQLQLVLSDSNMPAEFLQKASEALAVAQTKLTALVAQKTKFDTAITQFKTQIDSIDANDADWVDELIAYSKGGQASAPLFGPWGGYVYLGSIAIGAIAAALKKASDAKKTATNQAQTQQKLDESETAVDEMATAESIFQEYLDANPEAKAAYQKAQSNIITVPTEQKIAAIKAS